MDFTDWRKAPDKIKVEKETTKSRPNRFSGLHYAAYIDELIREAMDRGEFDNLENTGKPLQLDDDMYAGDKAMAYHLLKNNGFAPPEIEIIKEIRTERERAEKGLQRVMHWRRTLQSRRIAPFASEKRSFNKAVSKAATEYEHTLRELNRKILTANLSTPAIMHQPPIDVDKLVSQFRQSCPPFDV